MLNRKHDYYYQVTGQIALTGGEFCDFVVWTPNELHIQRILPNTEFIHTQVEKAELFFKVAVMPELLGKWFTRERSMTVPTFDDTMNDDSDDNGTWYYCQQVKGGDMVGCENKDCVIKWFHMECLKMMEPPKGKWFCPDCHPT